MRKRLQPTKLNIFACYLARVMANLHLILCFSRLGEAFRNSLRMFPSLVNCRTIDWFAEWPRTPCTASLALGVLTEENLELLKTVSILRAGGRGNQKFYGDVRRRDTCSRRWRGTGCSPRRIWSSVEKIFIWSGAVGVCHSALPEVELRVDGVASTARPRDAGPAGCVTFFKDAHVFAARRVRLFSRSSADIIT